MLEVLHRLTDLGNTVIIIEHNLDVVRNADWLIDLGPEGGEDGGRIVAEGTPEYVSTIAHSHTGEFLRRYYAQYFESPAARCANIAQTRALVERQPFCAAQAQGRPSHPQA